MASVITVAGVRFQMYELMVCTVRDLVCTCIHLWDFVREFRKGGGGVRWVQYCFT